MTLIDECLQGYAKLVAFFKARSSYISTGSTPENLDTIAEISYSESLTFSYDGAQDTGNVSTGVSNEIVAEFSSISREVDMARQSKSILYSEIQVECQTEATIFEQNSAYYAGILQGVSSTGSVN